MNVDTHGLSGAYAVDALDDVERAEFERHLAQCAECQAEVASLRAAAADLSLATAAEPPASLRDSVLAQISTVRPLPPVTGAEPPAEPAPVVSLTERRGRRPVAWLLAAAAAAVLAIGGLVWSPWDGGPQPQLTATEQVLRAEDAQRYTQTVDGARATIVRSASLGKAVIIADNMPAAPQGRDFQLWLDMPGHGMVSAGLMPHDDSPTVTMLLQGDAAAATGAGITVEPAGGSPRPTSAPIALFSFT